MYTQATLLALAAIAAAAPSPEAEPVHMPIRGGRLQPREDGTVDIAAVFRHINDTLIKYKADHTLLPLSAYGLNDVVGDILKERAVANEPLTDQGADIEYYGNGQVGATNPQTFTIDFDTGSADFFVPGPKCTGCKGTPYDDGGVNRHTTTSVTYGSGQISGNDYFDTVCVAGLCTTKTNVISLTSASGFSTSASNSLMGMAFSTIASSKEPTFFENLISQKKVTKPEFSFYLGRQKSGTGANSQMTLGGKDSSKYTGKSTSHKVTKKGYWQVAIDGVSISGSAIPALLTAGQAAIDTGTTVVIAPDAAALGIGTALGAVPIPIVATGSATETAFAYQCDTKDVVSLVFGNKKYAINPKDLSLGSLTAALAKKLKVPQAAGLCLSAIIADNIDGAEELYVVGDTFLKNWYTTFSFAKGASVSFAKSI